MAEEAAEPVTSVSDPYDVDRFLAFVNQGITVVAHLMDAISVRIGNLPEGRNSVD